MLKLFQVLIASSLLVIAVTPSAYAANIELLDWEYGDGPSSYGNNNMAAVTSVTFVENSAWGPYGGTLTIEYDLEDSLVHSTGVTIQNFSNFDFLGIEFLQLESGGSSCTDTDFLAFCGYLETGDSNSSIQEPTGQIVDWFTFATEDGIARMQYRFTPSEVPVPAAAWLFGSALFGLVGIKRKK